MGWKTEMEIGNGFMWNSSVITTQCFDECSKIKVLIRVWEPREVIHEIECIHFFHKESCAKFLVSILYPLRRAVSMKILRGQYNAPQKNGPYNKVK